MSETDTSPPPQGKLYVRPSRQNEVVVTRLVIDADWGVIVFSDRDAMERFAKEHQLSIVEGSNDGDDD